MFRFPSEGEEIRFWHNGRQYAMQPEEIEAAYRYQEHQYRLQDAERQLKYLCFGEEYDDDEVDAPSPREDIAEALELFKDGYGISYAEARKHLESFVIKFEMGFDCDITENTQWERAIKEALKDLSEQDGVELPF